MSGVHIGCSGIVCEDDVAAGVTLLCMLYKALFYIFMYIQLSMCYSVVMAPEIAVTSHGVTSSLSQDLMRAFLWSQWMRHIAFMNGVHIDHSFSSVGTLFIPI